MSTELNIQLSKKTSSLKKMFSLKKKEKKCLSS